MFLLRRIDCLLDHRKAAQCSYETNRLNPEPLWPNLISSYNDGFTSVASGGSDAELICCSAVVPFDEIVAEFDESGSILHVIPDSLLDKADI